MLYSTFITFLFTWFFHIYQWAWITGTNPVRPTGIIYWGTFAVLATISTFWISKRKKTGAYTESLIHASKVMGVFLLMSALYSMWTHATVVEWIGIVQVAFTDTILNWTKVLALVVVCVVMGSIFHYYWSNHKIGEKYKISTTNYSYISTAILTGALIVGLFITAPGLEAFRQSGTLNQLEEDKERVAYYDGILKADVSSEFWDDDFKAGLLSKKIDLNEIVDKVRLLMSSTVQNIDQPIINNDLGNETDRAMDDEEFDEEPNTVKWLSKVYSVKSGDALRYNLMSNVRLVLDSLNFSTNSHGIRDKEYTKKKAEGKYRMGVFGGSPTFGMYVSDEDVFESKVEERINETIPQFESLNFAQEGIRAFQYAYIMENRIKDWDLDMAFVAEHYAPFRMQTQFIIKQHNSEHPLYPAFEKFLIEAGINLNEPMGIKKRQEIGREIMAWSYQRMKNICEENGVELVVGFVPGSIRLKDLFNHSHKRLLEELEIDYIDISEVYKGLDRASLRTTANYPNAIGHGLIADELYPEILKRIQ